jgi:hypothetical protein
VNLVKINVSDTVPVSEALVGHKRGTDGSEALCTVDDVQSASAEYSPGSPPAFTLGGRNRHEAEGEVEVCSILLAYLDGTGQVYSGPRKVEDSAYPGVDCIAEGPTGTRYKQVTRAVRGDFREKLANAPEVSHAYGSFDEGADAIRETIEDKYQNLAVKRQLPIDHIDLVLDSRETLILVLDPDVLASFRRRHAAWTQGLGFRAVWLVGPAVRFVFRLA